MRSAQSDIIEALQEQVRCLEGALRPGEELVSSGCAQFDKLLPDRGFRRGTLVEWLAETASGAAGLALVVAREACREGETLVVIDPKRRFYPPAAAALGIDLARTIFVCPRNRNDQLWTLHQTLCCLGVGAVVCWPEKLDDRAFRKIQLAAERGRSLGFLLQPTSVRGRPTWSEMQLLITALSASALSLFPSPSTAEGYQHSNTNLNSSAISAATATRRLHVEILRSRGGKTGISVELEFNDEQGTLQAAHPVPLAAQLAAGAPGRRSSGA